MIETIMVVLLVGAAGYRVWLSVRSETKLWRTAFTTSTVGVAVAAALSVYGDVTVDEWLRVWNVSWLLTHLVLVATAVSTSVYVATLRQPVVPVRGIVWRVTTGAAVGVAQIASWAAAPVHARELGDFFEVWQDTSVLVFNLIFMLTVIAIAADTAQLCLSQAASRSDLTRTISLLLTGAACLGGIATFTVGMVGAVVRYTTGSDNPALKHLFNDMTPYVMVVLASGTLSLLAAPPFLDLVRSYLRWRVLRPLWADLICRAPEVHLALPVTGGPQQRLRLHIQRAIVEIHDALRVTRVHLPAGADLADLATALHRGGGQQVAADVLTRVDTRADDIDQLLKLARAYLRNRT